MPWIEMELYDVAMLLVLGMILGYAFARWLRRWLAGRLRKQILRRLGHPEDS